MSERTSLDADADAIRQAVELGVRHVLANSPVKLEIAATPSAAVEFPAAPAQRALPVLPQHDLVIDFRLQVRRATGPDGRPAHVPSVFGSPVLPVAGQAETGARESQGLGCQDGLVPALQALLAQLESLTFVRAACWQIYHPPCDPPTQGGSTSASPRNPSAPDDSSSAAVSPIVEPSSVCDSSDRASFAEDRANDLEDPG